MKDEIIRAAVELEAERQCKGLRADQRLASLNNYKLYWAKNLTEALRILDQAGYEIRRKDGQPDH